MTRKTREYAFHDRVSHGVHDQADELREYVKPVFAGELTEGGLGGRRLPPLQACCERGWPSVSRNTESVT